MKQELSQEQKREISIKANKVEFVAYIISSVLFVLLALWYDTSLLILPIVFLGTYVAKQFINKNYAEQDPQQARKLEIIVYAVAALVFILFAILYKDLLIIIPSVLFGVYASRKLTEKRSDVYMNKLD